jgi:PPOX class probable F420-dependent enzyme
MPAIGLQHSHAEDEVPASHRDLVECPPVAALTTLMPDGSPQTSVVWCDLDGTYVRVNTMRGFRKERNMRQDPRVTLLCYDPHRPLRSLEVRGRVEDMTEDGALDHLDALASKYMGRPVRYFGDCIAERFAETEVPVLSRIRMLRVVALDATAPGPESSPPRHADAGKLGPDQLRPVGAPPSFANEQEIPASHRDLLERAVCGVLTTLLPGGQPHSCLVWVDHDGTRARVNTTLQRQSGRDLAADPRLSLLVVDPDDTSRFIQVRGVAELLTDCAGEHLDALTRRYTPHPRYYGFIYPAEQAEHEQRVIVRIHARRITLDAIHV